MEHQTFTEIKYNSDWLDGLFFRDAFDRNFHTVRYFQYKGMEVDIATADFSYQYDKTIQGYWQTEDAVGLATVGSAGYINLTVAAVSSDKADAMEEFLRGVAPEEIPVDDGTVGFTFWSLSDSGPVSRRRKLEVPRWEELQNNYNESTYLELSSLIDPEFRPAKAGQLILWHGPPGTGKTTALRAMSREWRDWCEMHFITDPEQFFGSKANYMMSVMTEDTEKWRLLILEDCGELLAKDARAQLMNPQALSRFLNTVDGILGQGLKIMVLVTTNENLGKLHEAVTRPGRCLSEIEFKDLEPEKVEGWAAEHGIEIPKKSASLAELFAIKENFANKNGSKPKTTVGFGV